MMRARLIAAAAGATLLIGCDDSTQPQDPVGELVATVRAATTEYQDFDVAVAVGFEQASPCVASPEGGMGFHYARADRVDASVEPSEPEVLLYEPQTDGDMRLVGVEFLVLGDVWDAANDEPPALAGHPFDDHRPEELRHGLPFPHYELHVWAWVENTSGVMAPFNPAVACPAD
jgi:hypothetical protein